MHKKMAFTWRAVAPVVAALTGIVAGCTGHVPKIVDVRVAPVSDPVSSTSIRIVVSDRREFEVAPDHSSSPFVREREDLDSGLTSRLIGCYRPGADWLSSLSLLPEDRSVEQLIEQVLTYAFRRAGFRVTKELGEGAIPAEVTILNLWLYSSGGGYVITHNFEAHLRLSAPIGALANGIHLEHALQMKSSSFSMGSFGYGVLEKVFNRGLSEFGEQITATLREARENPQWMVEPAGSQAESVRSLQLLRDQGVLSKEEYEEKVLKLLEGPAAD